MEQRTNEWRVARKGRLTGSNCGSELGLDPWRSPSDLMRQMVREWRGAESEFTGNVATEYGTFNEANAVFDYELEHGTVQKCGFFAFEDWLGASPDGLLEEDGILEIKCPYGVRDGGEFKPLEDQPHYYAQMQIEMLCTDRRWAAFYQWASHSSVCSIVERNDEWLDNNLPRLRDFYNRYLHERTEAYQRHLEPKVKQVAADKVAARYRAAQEVMDAAKAELDAAKSAVVELCNGEKCEVSGLLVYPIKKEGAISYAKAIKDLLPGADLEPYRGAPSEYWMIK